MAFYIGNLAGRQNGNAFLIYANIKSLLKTIYANFM